MSQNAAAAMIEARARTLWDEREKRFPKFTRLRWEDGSLPARDVVGCEAFDQLMAEGLIEFRESGIHPGPRSVV